MPGILECFHGKFPRVRLEIVHLIKADQVQALAGRRISLGLTRSPVHTAQIASEVIHHEQFIAALHESHPLARRKTIPLEKLSADNFVLYRGNSWLSVADEIIGLCANAGFSPSVDQDTGEMQTAVSLVAAGLGVTVVAECIRSLLLPRVVYRPLTVRGRTPLTKLHVIYRKGDTNPALKVFLRRARSMG